MFTTQLELKQWSLGCSKTFLTWEGFFLAKVRPPALCRFCCAAAKEMTRMFFIKGKVSSLAAHTNKELSHFCSPLKSSSGQRASLEYVNLERERFRKSDSSRAQGFITETVTAF